MIYALEIPYVLRNVLSGAQCEASQPSAELSLRNCTQNEQKIILIQKLFSHIMPFLASEFNEILQKCQKLAYFHDQKMPNLQKIEIQLQKD